MARARVVVVEDETLVARGIQDKLLELGYSVLAVVDTGMAAVQKAGELLPDLVLMDIRLHGEMDGIEAAAQIRDRFDIPVVYLTAYSDDKTLQRAKVTDPFGYIVKPFRASELHSLVEMALYKHAIERELKASEARYRSVVEDQTEFIVRWLPEGTRTFVNRSYCSYFGLIQGEALGSSIFSLIPAANYETFRRQMEAVTPEHSSWIDQWQMVLPDGRMAWHQWTHRGLFDPRGHLFEFQSVGRDITQRVQAEQALLEAKEAAESAQREEERRRLEAERRRQIAEGLADVLAALNSDRALDDVLDLIATHTRALLDTEAVAVFRFSANAGLCTIQAAQGLPAALFGQATSLLHYRVLGDTVALRQPVTVPDVHVALEEDEGDLPDAASRTLLAPWAERYRALLSVPVVIRNSVEGAMVLYYSKPKAFSTEDVELAVLLGTQVALAVENARLKRDAEQAAVAAERSRLARELHDAVTQSLFSASLIAEALPQVWEQQPQEGRRGLQELRRLTQGALAEMRTLLLELRPAGVTEQTLGVLIRRLADAMAARMHMRVRATVVGERPLPDDVHVTLYRIVQEALNNTSKHARASHASVHLTYEPERVTLCISDDGCGFDPETVEPFQLGLGIMRERAQAIGASFSIHTGPAQGTELTVIWPGPFQTSEVS